MGGRVAAPVRGATYKGERTLSHIEFNEAFMNMTKGAARAPGTSRKGRVRRKSETPVMFSRDVASIAKSKVRPGVDPKILKYSRVNADTFNITLRDGGKLIAVVRKDSGKGKRGGYSYRLIGDRKGHSGFASMRELIARVATKI